MWPEFATCVGLWMKPDDSLGIIAPHGLGNLFSLIVRRNPRRASLETYRQRVREKDDRGKWPRVNALQD